MYENLHKTFVKHLNCKLYYQQLHLKHLYNLVRYWLQAVRGWHDNVETCSSVIICEITVHLFVTVQNNKRCMVQRIKINKYMLTCLNLFKTSGDEQPANCSVTCWSPECSAVQWNERENRGRFWLECSSCVCLDRVLAVRLPPHCRPDGLLIKLPPVPGRFKRFECSTP